MGWVKILNTGDAATELTGTTFTMLIVDTSGDVIELAHGAANKVLTSQGAAADPTWEDPSAGATLGGIGDVTISAVAEGELIKMNGESTWINQTLAEANIKAADGAPTAHLLGSHTTDTLANLNAKITDVNVDADSATRVPTDDSVGAAQIDTTAIDIAFANIILTPAATNASETEGAIFYDSDDDHLYVYVTA